MMNIYQVVITYKREKMLLESVFTVMATTRHYAKARAKNKLNKIGVFGTFAYKVYGGNKLIDESNLPF
jgi:hypothetical protein